MSYPAFPTLTTSAKLTMLFPEDVLMNPSTVVRYDGGIIAVRENNHRMIWKNTVVLQVDTVDRLVVLAFLKDTTRLRVYPFEFTHPDSAIGLIVVRFMADELPMPRRIQGLPIVSGTGDGSLYEIQLPLEEQYP